jgi:hypothetical protein
MSTFFIDTNVLVACRDLKDLDQLAWSPITQGSEIHLIIPHTVNREIDKLKEDGRARRRADRARLVNTLIKKIALTDSLQVVRIANPKISIALAPILNKRHVAIENFDLDNEDSRIVAEAKIFLHEHPNVPMALISHDGGTIHLAKVYGVPVHNVPDSWLLEPESDAPGRRMQELEKRLKQYEKHEPVLEFSTVCETSVSSDLIRRITYRPLTSENIEELIDRAREIHPMQTDFEEHKDQIHFPWVHDQWVPPKGSQIIKYQNLDYPAWIEQLRSILASLHLNFYQTFIPVDIFLKNIGSRPAQGLRVKFQLFGGAFFLPPDVKHTQETIGNIKLPPPPNPPSGHRNDPLWEHQQKFAELMQMKTPSLKIPALQFARQGKEYRKFYWESGRPDDEVDSWSFECEDFRHQEQPEIFSAFIKILSHVGITEFTIKCTASAANLTELKTECFKFRVQPEERVFFSEVSKVFDRFGTWRVNSA